MFVHTLQKPVLVYPGRISTGITVHSLNEKSWDDPWLEKIPTNCIVDCSGMAPCTGLVIKKNGEYFGYHRADDGRVLNERDISILGESEYNGSIALIAGKNPFKTCDKEVDSDLVEACRTDRRTAISKLEALNFNVLSGFSEPPTLESSSDLVVNTINGAFAIVQQDFNRRPYLISLGSFNNPEPADLKTATEDALALVKFIN